MIWFTSDTHFGHAKVIEYSDRPFSSVEEMDETLIENWNSVVGRTDTVYHIGDFAFRNHERVFRRLNGNKILIRGNHDRRETLTLPWASKHDQYSGAIGGHRFFLSHYSCRVWDRSHHGSFHVFGHSHGGLPQHRRSMDVGVDNIAKISGWYGPVSVEDVVGVLSPCVEFA